MHLTQSGDRVTATHTEAGGTLMETATCTVAGNKCVGTQTGKNIKTGKATGTSPVTISMAADGHSIAYTEGQQPPAGCKRN